MTGTRPESDDHVGDLVSAHLDGELDADTASRVSAHLARCEECRGVAADTAQARAWLRSLPAEDATPVVEHLLARHRYAIRAGASFVGLAMVVVGALALSAAVIRTDVVPDVDAMVTAHQAASAATDARGGGVGPLAQLDGLAAAKLVRSVGTPYSAPTEMHGNPSMLRRSAVYDGEDLTLVRYDNGEATVSVFQQPGRLDWSALPAGYVVGEGARKAWMPAQRRLRGAGRGPLPTVMVSEVGHVVVTVVSEDPQAVAAVVEGLPDSHRDSGWDRVHDACSRFTAVFTLSG